MRDQAIKDVLASLGYEGEAAGLAQQALIDAGLTRPGKGRIAVAKLPYAETALAKRFLRACGSQACQTEAAALARADGQSVVTVPRESCDICGGSENARAVREMAQAMELASRTRLLVIGGTPNIESELIRLLPSPCQVRFVLAGGKKTAKDAAQDAGWADFIVVWASTPIGHKTSALYKPYKPLTVSRRSISALAGEVTLSLADPR
ncbi:MAG: hypothetical protein WD645_03300 [Dehalococcoidia bacterium]